MRTILITMLGIFGLSSLVFAEWVNGYFRRNGTHVSGYYRTGRDRSPYNNQSMPGNYNYNTGRVTTGDRNKYLNNYYAPKTYQPLDDIGYTKKHQRSNTTWGMQDQDCEDE